MLVPKSNFVKSLKSKYISIQQPLFVRGKRPTGGWRVKFTIRGTEHSVTAASAISVYAKMANIYQINDIEMDPATLWYNMNHQWYSRTRSGKLTNDVELNELATDGGKDEVPDNITYYHPKEWGAKAWNWLGLYLAKDKYVWADFVRQTEEVLELLNPVDNTAVGCIDCYREFAIHVAKLKNSPIYEKQAARMWLWDTHNSVNKRLDKTEITFSEASKLNHW